MDGVAQAFRPAGTAIGFRIKSGYAIAVVLAGPASSPIVLARRIVELCDPDVAETKQPYHDGFGTENENPREIARRVKIVERCAKKSVASLLDDMRSAKTSAERPLRAALVVGSVIDPQQVGNPHIRAHANEGKLFRTVVEDALRAHGIACDVIVEKRLAATASAGLRLPESAIKQKLTTFGKIVGSPWRTDEKAAAIAAWLALRPSNR